MARRFILKANKDKPAPKELTIDYASQLNEQQLAAVMAAGGPYLVIAGAGTGKTRTLVYRVAYLVETGVAPEQIILLTFTRRSANEMLTRASSILDGRCNRVRGGTFHAFCLTVLKEHAPLIGLPANFTILDASDDADVIDVLRTAKRYNKGASRFPRKGTLQSIYSASVNRELPVEEVLANQYPHFLGHMEAIQDLQIAYEEYKKQHGLVNFDDLLRYTVDLLSTNDTVRQRVSTSCRHLLVDEYQDTNRLQAELIYLLADVHRNVMVVGDDAQSIYRFRGADFRNIFAFPDQYPDAQILKLEQNYRSTQPILDVANYVIQRAKHKYDKHLFSTLKEGELPGLVAAPDERFESRFVSQMVLQLREEGIPLGRMAVLFRGSANSFDLEVELGERGIPYVKYGGMKLSEAAHVKDVLAYLRILENPKDAVAWNRVLQLLPGIGPKTAQDIVTWVTTDADDPFALENRPFSPRYIEALKALFGVLRPLLKEATSLTHEVEAIITYYEPLLKQKYFEDYPKRLQDLEHFIGLAENGSDRSSFLSSLALDPIELTALNAVAIDDDEAPLILSTIHSAKGLEFQTVFLIHALDGIIPSGYSLKEEESLDEELRLLYVAVTRAERNLFISYPVLQYRRHHGEVLSKPSRFVDNVPQHLLEPWSLIEEHAESQPDSDAKTGKTDNSSDEAFLPF
ncbi:MAG: ATP-dependent helicase [Rhodothermaceae bacterium]|nr:ATP-dependent helicase [Rhodothermaceae bacterium]